MGDRGMTNKLSPSWMEVFDQASQRYYYANITTKEVSWVKPEEAIKKELEEQEARKSKKKKKDVWLERQDPKSGRVYYYNPAKRETSWHRPEETISAGAIQAEDGRGAWVERQDPRTGRAYYYNPVLGKTSWTNPDAEDDKRSSVKAKHQSSALKRLSTSLGAAAMTAGNRVSMGLNRLSFGNSGGNARNSARFSLNEPVLPVNKTEGRMSLRLGANLNQFDEFGKLDVKQSMTHQSSDDDKFAKLRAMKNAGAMPVNNTKKGAVDPESYLRIDIDQMVLELNHETTILDFGNYARQNFLQKKKGMFGGTQLDVNVLRSYQRKPIVQPLHQMGDKNLISDALYAFKTLLNFCGDKPSRKDPDTFAKLFLSYGNATAPILQRELYAQLIKQSTNNQDQVSEQRVWELLALVCGTFPPPEAILPFVKSHLQSAADTPPSADIKRFAEYALLRLERVSELDGRLEVPCLAEISAVRSRRPYTVNVNLISGTSMEVEVDTWSTIDDLRYALEKRFGIQDGSPFAIYEMNDDENERVLEGGDRVMDLVAFWKREIEARQTKKYTPVFNFVYKIRLFFDISEDDTTAIELAYLQAVFEVLDQRYPCTKDDCLILAGLEAQEKFGDFTGKDVFGDELGAYIPQKFYSQEDDEELKARVYQHYQEFRGYDKLLCMINYLNYVKGWKYYGSAYYFADPITLKLLGKEFPKTVIIGINAKGILIIDPPTLDLIAEYPYSELVTWGYSATNFVFVVGNLVRSQKLFFKTNDGVEMNTLIHSYVNKLMEGAGGEGQDGMGAGSDDGMGMGRMY